MSHALNSPQCAYKESLISTHVSLVCVCARTHCELVARPRPSTLAHLETVTLPQLGDRTY